jgi:tRNA dimethylallyltransferase
VTSNSLWPNRRLPIVIVGPTATGKTAAAIALAEQIGGEIINADSMQVYRGMEIGTAKPEAADRQRVRFHLLDIIAPEEPFSVAEWKRRAESAIVDIDARGCWPIICGGTGLYVRALLDAWSLADTPANPEIRRALAAEADREGASALHARLQQVDPVTAERLHPNDAVRIVRALEVYSVTGIPISDFRRRDQRESIPRPAYRLGLTLPRQALYAAIDRRVDAMLASGLVHEVRGLLDQGYAPTLSPLKSLGYKEIIQYFHGEMDFPTTVEKIKQNTRRFAKRQQTWFRADSRIVWFDVTTLSSATVASQLWESISHGSTSRADPGSESPDLSGP